MSKYLLRSLMFVPGHNERLLASAARSNADVLLLDIEDSVQPQDNKQIARDTIKKSISPMSASSRYMTSMTRFKAKKEESVKFFSMALPLFLERTRFGSQPGHSTLTVS